MFGSKSQKGKTYAVATTNNEATNNKNTDTFILRVVTSGLDSMNYLLSITANNKTFYVFIFHKNTYAQIPMKMSTIH